MTSLRVGSILLALAACGFAPVPRHKPKKTPDLAALAGAWRVVQYQQNGRSLMMQAQQMHMRVEKDRLTFYVNEGNAASSYQLTVNPTASPATMDWHNGAGHPISYAAIYALEGNTLSVAFADARRGGPVPARPTSLKELRPQDYLIVFQRVPASR